MEKLNIEEQVIGSCNCSNKTPEFGDHDELCYFRLLMEKTKHMEDLPMGCRVLDDIGTAAQSLFDNRLGWSDGKPPHAPRSFWADLGAALYGDDDVRVKELRQ